MENKTKHAGKLTGRPERAYPYEPQEVAEGNLLVVSRRIHGPQLWHERLIPKQHPAQLSVDEADGLKLRAKQARVQK
jgi:hypothetical protein